MVVHLYDTQQPSGSGYIKTSCGYLKHHKRDAFFITKNKEEVTCTKCLDKIENPIRSLRSYGNLHFGKYHISIFPHPYRNIFVSAHTYDQTNWDLIIYNDHLFVKETFTAKTKKDLAKCILKKLEEYYSINQES